MPHLHHDPARLLARIHRIAGQVAAIERSVTAGAPCAQTLHLAAAIRGAIGGLMDELVEDHLREHVAAPGLSDTARAEGAEELAVVLKRHFR